MPSKIIPQCHRDAMIEAYLGGASAREAAEPFGYSYAACIFALKKHGIPRRSRSEARRKYAVDEDYFSEINGEEKAYWLGFLSADGCVTERGQVSLRLSIGDKCHIEKFVTSLASEHPIRTGEVKVEGITYQYAVVVVCSMKLAHDLMSLGVVPQKSLKMFPCDSVPQHLVRHYWRGIFDGDGSIFQVGGRKSLKYAMTLTGNYAILSGFQKFVERHVDLGANIQPKRGSHVFSLSYRGVGKMQELAQLMYNDATIFLERKMNKIDKLLQLPNQLRDWSHLDASKLEGMHDSFGTWNNVADELGMSRSQLWAIRKRRCA